MTRQQKWAAGALERVKEYHDAPREQQYRTLCMKMPVLIHQSGLVQALAFVRARSDPKKGDVGKAFCSDLARVYGNHAAQDPGATLSTDAQGAPLPRYLLLTRDVIAVATWFRRFAQSELKKPEGGSDE